MTDETGRAPWRERSWCVHETVVNSSPNHRSGSDDDKRFLALALFGEAGEFANLVKKDWRKAWGHDPGNLLPDMIEELADTQIYFELLARCYHWRDLDERGLIRHYSTVTDCVFDRSLQYYTLCLGESAGRVCYAVDPDPEDEDDPHQALDDALASLEATLENLWGVLGSQFGVSCSAMREKACADKEAKVARRYGGEVQRAIAQLDVEYSAKNSHADGTV